jgi:signal transduction histidine kinase
MPVRERPLQIATRLRRPSTTVRGRLTLLYGSLFLGSGVVLLAITYILVEHNFPALDQTTIGPGGSQVNGAIPGSRRSAPLTPGATAALVAHLRGADLHHLLVDSSIALTVMVIISIGLGWLVAGRVLRPLRFIIATTREISEDNLHERLALEGRPGELRDLSDTIDALLARLDAAFDAQRSFTANASHELRTPLTVGRTLLEMVLGDPDATIESYRAVCQDVIEAGEQQEQLIEALLTLARSQRGLDRRQPLELAAIATTVAHARQAAATADMVRLDLAVRPAALSGDPYLVERLVSNLVDNALRYNRPGGNVHVIVDTDTGQARLKVTNTGPRVPSDQFNRLLQPFQRIAPDRAGHHDGIGLGLSIVQAITTAHGGHLDLQSGPAGGLDVEIRFPPPPAVTNANELGRSPLRCLVTGPSRARSLSSHLRSKPGDTDGEGLDVP